jgi:hydroxyethylthiazole kinase-like uncharacterized protein yjeF
LSEIKQVTPEFLCANPLPTPEREGDKNQRGRVLVIAGSVEVPGAALLAGLGALRAGAGVLRIATCRSVALQLGIALPEAFVGGCPETSRGGIDPASSSKLIELAEGVDAVLIGPGMMDNDAVGELVRALLKGVTQPQIVLDAAAFTEVRDDAEIFAKHSGRIVVTPHSGEMARFLGQSRDDIDADRRQAATKTARIVRGVVALKGASTSICDHEGQELLSDHGTVGLGTSGSGDTLAGILVGLLARGTPPLLATAWAVYLHAEAGQRLATRNGTFGLLAREIPHEVPRIMADLTRQA